MLSQVTNGAIGISGRVGADSLEGPNGSTQRVNIQKVGLGMTRNEHGAAVHLHQLCLQHLEGEHHDVIESVKG